MSAILPVDVLLGRHLSCTLGHPRLVQKKSDKDAVAPCQASSIGTEGNRRTHTTSPGWMKLCADRNNLDDRGFEMLVRDT